MTLAQKMKAALAKINAVLAQSGFTAQVTGGDKLSLNLAGNQIDQPEDFYLSGYRKQDGGYVVNASLHILQSGIDGFLENVRLEWAGGDNASMTEVDPAIATIKTPRELQAEVAAHVETIAGFNGYLSPAEAQAKVEEAVATAIADAKKGAGDDTKNLLTPDQGQALIDDAMAKRDALEASMKSRSEALVAGGFVLTEERKASLTEFTADEAGDQAFATWIKALETEQAVMLKELESKDVEITAPIKAAVACLNSKSDSGFTALMASHGAQPESRFSPSMDPSGDVADDELGKFKRVC